jgi:hypothetical protein
MKAPPTRKTQYVIERSAVKLCSGPMDAQGGRGFPLNMHIGETFVSIRNGIIGMKVAIKASAIKLPRIALLFITSQIWRPA